MDDYSAFVIVQDITSYTIVSLGNSKTILHSQPGVFEYWTFLQPALVLLLRLETTEYATTVDLDCVASDMCRP